MPGVICRPGHLNIPLLNTLLGPQPLLLLQHPSWMNSLKSLNSSECSLSLLPDQGPVPALPPLNTSGFIPCLKHFLRSFSMSSTCCPGGREGKGNPHCHTWFQAPAGFAHFPVSFPVVYAEAVRPSLRADFTGFLHMHVVPF